MGAVTTLESLLWILGYMLNGGNPHSPQGGPPETLGGLSQLISLLGFRKVYDECQWSLPAMNCVHSSEQLTSPEFSSGDFSQCHNHLMALYAHSGTGKPVAVKSKNVRV